MAKTIKQQAKRSKKSPARPQGRPRRKNSAASEAMIRASTKQARAIEMLRAKGGVSIAALMEATGWQQHSVRGFLAGVVRKRLKLNLISAVESGVRTYRIAGESTVASPKTRGTQSKSS